jgi:hypothetical protein
MPKRSGLTLEEHKALGARAKRVQEELNALFLESARAYGVTKPQTKTLYRLERRFALWRYEMEDVMFREHPEVPRSSTKERELFGYYLGGVEGIA